MSSSTPPIVLPIIILHRAPNLPRHNRASSPRHRSKTAATTVLFDPSLDSSDAGNGKIDRPRRKRDDIFYWKPMRRRLTIPEDPALLHRFWRPRANQPDAIEIKKRGKKSSKKDAVVASKKVPSVGEDTKYDGNKESKPDFLAIGEEIVKIDLSTEWVDLAPKRIDLTPKMVAPLDFMTQTGPFGDYDDDDDSDTNSLAGGSDSDSPADFDSDSLADSDSGLDDDDNEHDFFVGDFADDEPVDSDGVDSKSGLVWKRHWMRRF
ncbi:hypothetical protein CP532_4841 [Ophiocordyceps camponoti-leonardi (nom. inval.)]|nr:hypothetical protein CP532_4841 [Ophiocordyceps camponoti-leonardi (nom. inval.)]